MDETSLNLVRTGTAEERQLSLGQYKALTKWLRLCGIIAVWQDDVHAPLRKYGGFFSKYLAPFLFPSIFFLSTIWQDSFCYGDFSGCRNIPLFGLPNVTYNERTIYIWIGVIVAGTSLYANVLTYARKGKLESLFRQLPSSPYDAKIRMRIRFWVGGGCLLIIVALIVTASYILTTHFTSNCATRHLFCMVPQAIQIVSGLCTLLTGVGLTHILSLLLRMKAEQNKIENSALLAEGNMVGYIESVEGLKAHIKQVASDMQVGNVIAFIGGCCCIFGSVWAFAENYADPTQKASLGYSLSVWTFIVSLFLTFLILFSFADVTKACDGVLENSKLELSRFAVRKPGETITVSECYVIISSYQQRFGFEIVGVLIEPEIVRALAAAGVTAASTILKLAI